MLRFILFTLFLGTAALVNAQSGMLEGIIADSTGVGLPAATVVLMHPKDSIMSSFGVSDPNGHFLLKRVAPGEHLLQISYLGYEPYYQRFTLDVQTPKLNLGTLKLQPANTLLKGVDINAQRAPMAFKKDTVEYNAGAFQTQPGSVVEDLLKKLPGVEVQSDGSIRAHGERVQNVLVEGKEFFGQDPKIATKNLPADAVDKVQVYDKKSERAEFTGIEDGRDEKTINLKLKEDKKNGYFGNANAGYGTEERYEGRFNINSFGKKTQMSALGLANNNNQPGFSFDDYLNFMGGLSNFMGGGGGSGSGGRVRISINPEEMGISPGGSPNKGFTTAWAGGLNLNRDLSKNTRLSANYFYNRLQNEADRTVTRQNLLGDAQSFDSRELEERLSRNANHRLNLTLRHKIDSMQDLRVRGRFSFNDALLNSDAKSETFDSDGITQNTNQRDNHTNGENLSANVDLTYRLRFGKKGRALVAEASFQKSDNERNGRLVAESQYLQNMGNLRESLQQRQTYTDDATNYGASVSFTEPLGKRQYLEWQLGHQQYANKTGKSFYDQVLTPTPGEVFNPLLSNRYRRGYRYERGGMNYLLNREKYNLTLGATLQQSVLDGKLLDPENPPVRRAFTRVLPNAFFDYDFATSRHLSLEYTTNLQEPSLEQLQPAVDNSDPLNVYTGNPNLRPEYGHTLGANLMLFDQFTMTSFFASLNTTYTQNRITNASSVDSLFRRFIQPVNVERDVNLNAYISYARPLRFIKSNLNMSLNSTNNRGILFVNEQRNNTDRWVNSLDIGIDNRKKEKIDWSISARLTHNSTRYSISEALNQDFINQRYRAEATLFPTKKWALGTGLDYLLYSAETFGEARTVPLWRANVTRYVLKNRKGQIKLSAYDLLNRNISISRSSQFNYIEEESTRNLGRYFMLSFAYSISGFGPANGGGMQVRMIGREE